MGCVKQEEDDHSNRLWDVIAVSVFFCKRAEFSSKLGISPDLHHSLNSALVRHFLFITRYFRRLLSCAGLSRRPPLHLKVFHFIPGRKRTASYIFPSYQLSTMNYELSLSPVFGLQSNLSTLVRTTLTRASPGAHPTSYQLPAMSYAFSIPRLRSSVKPNHFGAHRSGAHPTSDQLSFINYELSLSPVSSLQSSVKFRHFGAQRSSAHPTSYQLSAMNYLPN